MQMFWFNIQHSYLVFLVLFFVLKFVLFYCIFGKIHKSLIQFTFYGFRFFYIYFQKDFYIFIVNKCYNYCLTFSGLISPGVSVPVQIPGGGPQDMGVHHMTSMTSQYWSRIQWWFLWRHLWRNWYYRGRSFLSLKTRFD